VNFANPQKAKSLSDTLLFLPPSSIPTHHPSFSCQNGDNEPDIRNYCHVFYVGIMLDTIEIKRIMKGTKSSHLQNVLDTHSMSHIDELIEKYREKRNTVKEFLEDHYKSQIYNPINSGSIKKATAINNKFDFDVVAPFKYDSFETLEMMFNDVFEELYEEYKDVATVRKQKVSIGIEFFEDEDNDVISLDIVPGRELNEDQYSDDNKLNLYVNSRYGTIEEKSYIQTNIQAQIDHIKGKDNERTIIKLLKIWKSTNGEDFKSFLIELISIKAFDKTEIAGNLWEKLKSVMNYIESNITTEGFTLTDPGNSNNDVMDSISEDDRKYLSDKMELIVRRIEENENNIDSYFPINEEFGEDEESYGIKGSTIAISTPSNNERFG